MQRLSFPETQVCTQNIQFLTLSRGPFLVSPGELCSCCFPYNLVLETQSSGNSPVSLSGSLFYLKTEQAKP